MTYSQINHAKAWGFSRKPLNLNFWKMRKEMRSGSKALSEVTHNKCYRADLVALKNLAILESSQDFPKSLMWGSLNEKTPSEATVILS